MHGDDIFKKQEKKRELLVDCSIHNEDVNMCSVWHNIVYVKNTIQQIQLLERRCAVLCDNVS